MESALEEEEVAFSDSENAANLHGALWGNSNATASSNVALPTVMNSAWDFQEGALPVVARRLSAHTGPLIIPEGFVEEDKEDEDEGEEAEEAHIQWRRRDRAPPSPGLVGRMSSAEPALGVGVEPRLEEEEEDEDEVEEAEEARIQWRRRDGAPSPGLAGRMSSAEPPLGVDVEPRLEEEEEPILSEQEMEIDVARMPPHDSPEEPLPPPVAVVSAPLMPPAVEMESSRVVEDEGEELHQQQDSEVTEPLVPSGLETKSGRVAEEPERQRERMEPEQGNQELTGPQALQRAEMEIDAARAAPLDAPEEPQTPPVAVFTVPLMPPGVEMESNLVVEDEGEEQQQQHHQEQQQQHHEQQQQPQQQQHHEQQQQPQQQQQQQQKEVQEQWEDPEAGEHVGPKVLQSEEPGAPAPQPFAVLQSSSGREVEELRGAEPPVTAEAAEVAAGGGAVASPEAAAPGGGRGGAAVVAGHGSLQEAWKDLLAQQPKEFVWSDPPATAVQAAETAAGGGAPSALEAAGSGSGGAAGAGRGSLQAAWNDLLTQQPEEFVWGDPPAAPAVQARSLPNVSKLACCSQFRELLAEEEEGETETDTSTTTMTETSTSTEESAASKTDSSTRTSTSTESATETVAAPTTWTATVTETGTTSTSTTTPHTMTTTSSTTATTSTATSTTTPHTTTETTTTTLTSTTGTSSTTEHTTTATSSSTLTTFTLTSTTTEHTTTETSSSTVSSVTWTSTTTPHTTTETASSTTSSSSASSTTTAHTTTETASSTTSSSSVTSTTTAHTTTKTVTSITTTTSTTTWSSTTVTSTTATSTLTSTSSTTTTLDIAALLALAQAAENELLDSLWADFSGNVSVAAPVTTFAGITTAAVFTVSNESIAVAEIDLPGTNVKVGIPSSVLLQASNGGGAAAAAVSQLDRTTGTSSPPLSIRLLSPDGEVLEGVQLAEPIKITLAGGIQVGGGSCAFWDPSTGLWSLEGLTDVPGEAGELLCETTHLSLFAIIESVGEVLQCTNVKILTAEGFESFWSTHWLNYPASIGFFILIAAHLLVLVAILKVDREARRNRSQAWDDELFLTNDMSLLDQRDAVKKAKETVQSTFTYEFCVRQVALEAISYELRISPEDLKYVLSRGAEKLQANFTEALNRLAPRILEAFWEASFLRRCWVLVLIHHPWSRLRLISIRKGHFTRLLIVFGQIFGSLMLDALFFISAGLSTSYKSGPSCEPQGNLEKTVRFIVVGFVSSAMTTFMLFAVPKLMSRKRFLYAQEWSQAKKRRQLRAWKAVEWLLQMLLLLYLAASIFYILLFLANVTKNTGVAWAIAAISSVIRDLLLGPMALSAVIVLGAAMARRWHPTPLQLGAGGQAGGDGDGEHPPPINLCEVVTAVRPFSQLSAGSAGSCESSPRSRAPGGARLRGILGVLKLDQRSIGLHCPCNNEEDETGGALSPIVPVQPRAAWEVGAGVGDLPEEEGLELQDDAAWRPSSARGLYSSGPQSWQEAAELSERWEALQGKETPEELHDRYLSALGAGDDVPHATSSEALHEQYLSALGGGIGIDTVAALTPPPEPPSAGSTGEDDWARPVRAEEHHDTLKHALMGYATNDWRGVQGALEEVPEAELEGAVPGVVPLPGAVEASEGSGSPVRKAKSALQAGAEAARQALARAGAAERPGSAPGNSSPSPSGSQQFQAVVPSHS